MSDIDTIEPTMTSFALTHLSLSKAKMSRARDGVPRVPSNEERLAAYRMFRKAIFANSMFNFPTPAKVGVA